jgi:DHA2 family multidrug resistance protein-like MFS transporter
MEEVVDVAASGGPPRVTGRVCAGLAVLALPTLLVSMDLTVLHLAVPAISADLRPSSAQLLWIVDIYGFLVAGCLITMGTLGDRIGRRRLLLAGAAAFSAASVLAAFAVSAEMLIATRALHRTWNDTGTPALSLACSSPSSLIWGTATAAGGIGGPAGGAMGETRYLTGTSLPSRVQWKAFSPW